MGAAASISSSKQASNEEDAMTKTEVVLKKLPDAVEEAVYVHEKFPLVVDPSEQASRFFKYQTGAFINQDDPLQFTPHSLNRALVASFLNGRTLTLKFNTLEDINEKNYTNIFDPKLFPIEVLDRSKFFDPAIWQNTLQEKLGDPPKDEASISSEFVLIICTATSFVPKILQSCMHLVKVIDPAQINNGSNAATSGDDNNNNALSSGDSNLDMIASLYGAQEVIRNSLPLVEAAFDGDLEEVQAQVAKGFHLESFDGRKQTALSEAACQGHVHVVNYLLEQGADPNSLSDTGRSPLWRAAFNGHLETVKILLQAGSNPQYRDRISMESAYDVASTPEIQALLQEWDINTTESLMTQRRLVMMKKLEERIQTSAEREFLAKHIIRKELIDKAEKGDVEGIKDLLHMIVTETKATNSKPRATVEVRNDLGQSLLSIASQQDNYQMAEFLLTYWKTLDTDRWDLVEGEVSEEAKVFKANPNSRDLKGWNCVCIAVFHDARKVLPLLLEHGGDMNARSSYNKNAWDLAKDELDAAEKVIKSHAEIRNILIEFDRHQQSQRPNLFAKKDVVSASGKNALYEGLDKDGNAMVMNIEMNQEGVGLVKDEDGGKDAGKKATKKGGGGDGNKKASSNNSGGNKKGSAKAAKK